MKIMTIAGTRPEWIRLSRIIAKLDKYCEHIIVDTRQNYTYELRDIFFNELKIRKPDYCLEIEGSIGKQLSEMSFKIEEILLKEKPNKVLILGDTNSGLCSIICERLGIHVYHMEAGNRCFDNNIPEEVNRRIIDHTSTYNLPYTKNSQLNLLNEGIKKERIFKTGNPIYEVIENYQYEPRIDILEKYNLKKNEYILCTFHRSETVDNSDRLSEVCRGLDTLYCHYIVPKPYKLFVSVHPRTHEKIEGKQCIHNMTCIKPTSFVDFINLEKNAKLIMTDSGTVSEEACIFRVPCVIMRDVTERPELLECGSAILSGVNQTKIFNSAQIMLDSCKDWVIPEGYLDTNVSDKVVQYLLGEN